MPFFLIHGFRPPGGGMNKILSLPGDPQRIGNNDIRFQASFKVGLPFFLSVRPITPSTLNL